MRYDNNCNGMLIVDSVRSEIINEGMNYTVNHEVTSKSKFVATLSLPKSVDSFFSKPKERYQKNEFFLPLFIAQVAMHRVVKTAVESEHSRSKWYADFTFLGSAIYHWIAASKPSQPFSVFSFARKLTT